MTPDIPTLQALRQGGKPAMAQALASIERLSGDSEICKLLDEAHAQPKAHVVGFTGPPGVGKSTLINEVVRLWRAQALSVGVIAVDPSSRMTGGALLGDRTRMTTDPSDDNVFVRSLASRGTLGGLTELAFPAMTLMRAVYDRVIVETVGVGQSEADISSVADTVILCVQPGSGDSLQFMKAGIMEIPDIAIVTKADFGKQAERAVGEMQGALSLSARSENAWNIPVLAVSASKGSGLKELLSAIDEHRAWLERHDRIDCEREERATNWVKTTIATRFGTEGLSFAEDRLLQNEDRWNESGPFSCEFEVARQISQSLRAD